MHAAFEVPRWRRVAWPIIATIAVVAVLAASFAVWQRRLVFSTDEWVEMVAPLPRDPAVAAAVGRAAGDAVVEQGGLEQGIAGRLPDQLAPLAPLLTDTVRRRVEAIAARLVASDEFERVWIAINRRAHQATVDVLRGGGILDAKDGEVRLNLLPLIAAVLREAESRGLPVAAADRDIPEIGADLDVDTARGRLSEALGRELPPGFGQIVVYRGDQVELLQRGVRIVDRLIALMVVLAMVFVAAAILIAPDRRRAVVRLSLAVVLVLLVVRALVPTMRQALLEAISGPGDSVVASVFDRLVGSATGGLALVFLVALLGAALGALVGPSRAAVSARAALAAGGPTAPAGVEVVAGAVGRHVDAARVVGVLFAVALVVIGDLRGWSFVALGIVTVCWLLWVGRCCRRVAATTARPEEPQAG